MMSLKCLKNCSDFPGFFTSQQVFGCFHGSVTMKIPREQNCQPIENRDSRWFIAKLVYNPYTRRGEVFFPINKK
jgi:hypothetical protein